MTFTADRIREYRALAASFLGPTSASACAALNITLDEIKRLKADLAHAVGCDHYGDSKMYEVYCPRCKSIRAELDQKPAKDDDHGTETD